MGGRRAMRTLLVGLNEDAARMAARMLADRGEVSSVPGAARALAAFSASPPDLVVISEPLPDQDAATLCRAIRARAAGAGVVILVLVDRGERVEGLLAAG